ncbi:hypothetical protein B0I35DRAFT_415644 [Stachybotrys elegans]|uniref:Uncharacterized protein n=1 Tax=Stachybotrys elegans TaxID=80388 RepID=A0A8K0WWS7_9HYPO|nr:hypothetical protein B0I35DRAFT_415644 [Stachybotrys elegans]
MANHRCDVPQQPKPEDKKCQKNIRLCYDDLSSLDRNHNRFRELFDKHVSHLTSLIRDLNEQEKQELALLISCRHMSTVLCRQLGSLCDEHDDHQVYVNLEKIERRSEGKCQWISFELAFQRCDQEEQGFVLIHAEIMVNEDSLSNSFTSTSDQSDTTLSSPHLQTPIINPVGGMNHERACFCIGSLANGMNFRFKIGTGTQVQQCPFPGGAGTSLLSLAEWIRQAKMEQKDFNDSNIDRRVRLACLVAEAVLKFEIALWSPEILTSQTIMLAADGTHMRVCLAQQRYLGSPSPRQPSTVSKILQSLGVVLLELGLLEVIPENVLSRGSNELIDNLEDEMGRHYTAVVRFCIGYEDETDGDNSLRDKGIYDLSIQEYFYQRVIRLLKANDNLVEQYANSRG